MNAHDRCLELVAVAIDFGLSPNERRTVDRHLESCPSCPRTAAGIATDAATIAALPILQRDPRRADGVVLNAQVRRGWTPIRLVAVAALLALLALGAALAGAEVLRRLDHANRLSLTPDTTLIPGPTLTPDTSPTAGPPDPSNGPSSPVPSTLAAPCNPRPTVDEVAAHGGGWALGCLGSREIALVGYAPLEAGASVCDGWEPQWLSCPSGSLIAARAGVNAPFLAYAHDGDVPIDRPARGLASDDAEPVNGYFARFTGHFGDAASVDCRTTRAGVPFSDDPAGLQKHCRETFVVTRIAILTGADVPKPEVPGTWTTVAGPATLPRKSPEQSTVLRSIVELDDRLFILAYATDVGSNLWTSADGETWEAVDTGGYLLRDLASDGTRLFGVSANEISEQVRTSADGRTWSVVPGLPADASVVTVTATSDGVFTGGGRGIDAAIWRFDTNRWVSTALPGAAGWQGSQDGLPALVYGIADLGGRVSAFGFVPETPQRPGRGTARLWQWKTADSWLVGELPSPVAKTPMAGLTWSGPGSSVIVGTDGYRGPTAWWGRGGSYEQATFHGSTPLATASLIDVVEVNGSVLAVGYAEPDGGFPVVVWGSTEGANWWPLDADDMSGGHVEDLLVTSAGRIFAVGSQPGTGEGLGSEPGLAVWELIRR